MRFPPSLTSRSEKSTPFFESKPRCTVAVSRHRTALIIIGNYILLAGTDPWKTVIDSSEFTEISAGMLRPASNESLPIDRTPPSRKQGTEEGNSRSKHYNRMFPRHGPVETFNFGYNLRQRSYGTLLFIAVVGIPLNIFLLYLIHRFSRKELGAYKHLLTIFAAHDILLSIIEALFNLTAVRIGTIISVVGRTFWESRHISCVYVAFYSVPLFLTNLNFLYRYWAIKSPMKLERYSSKSFIGGVVLSLALTFAGWYIALFQFCDGGVNEPDTIILRGWYSQRYNITIYDGWVVMDYWPDGRMAMRPFLVLLFTDGLLLTSFITAVSLSTMTFYHIHINTMVSDNYRRAQRTVLIALCAQTSVPLLCVYVPYVNTLNAPFLDVDNLISPEIAASFVSAFPLWDAVVIILLMKDYRVGAKDLIFGKGTSKIDAKSMMFTTNNVIDLSQTL
ncbi:hypothetical protein PRIPAC_76893 [Pristionchus pacificus]|uniref:G protein-coupled receptor n=1 Tax=Pristionchus pacificus TaxID=54126 RepID=A0A2A6C491_PRIPA|nr:hypothetical protein PRIPAC_76893 [Pristionchus pacificus]|eukprot:PDM73052.1 G protein-coupled receptor [Pristionchus pacificus]